MMHRISGFKLKSTIHQVLDIGVTRQSSPFFLEPSYYANLPVNLFEKENETDFCYGDWLIDAMSTKYGEWKELK